MKAVRFVGIVIAVAMIIFGLVYALPEKEVQVSGYRDKGWAYEYGIEYVGGDAYNYQIESSLKAGYYTGVVTMKSICVVGGILLLFLSLYSLARMEEADTHARVTVQAMAEYLALNRDAECALGDKMDEMIQKLTPPAAPEKTEKETAE